MSETVDIEVVAIESENLDTVCFRGSAPLKELARISQADVFDQVTNPQGLQRDLSPKHASDAYRYAAAERDPQRPRAFPEVILNVRNPDVVSIEKIPGGRQTPRDVQMQRVTFIMDAINDAIAAGKIAVSRVDGNHRLFYADGDDKTREPLDAMCPFQLHIGLTPEEEVRLFTDVNANQKGLNSSHLHILQSRLTPEEVELRERPERVFARRLAEDENSPWHDMLYLGGAKAGSKAEGAVRPVSFVSLENGVRRTLSKSQYIHDLTQPDAQYALIRNFWNSVRRVFREEWDDPKEFLLLKNLGVMSFSILGGTIIDRCMARGEIEPSSMDVYVKQIRGVFDWHREAVGDRSVVGMSGNRAALIVAGEMASNLVDPGESRVVLGLQERLLQEAQEAVAA